MLGENPVLKSMKIIDVSTQASAAHYLGNMPEKTHTKEELESVHRAIRFTQQFKQEEARLKMEQEELLNRPLPAFGGRK